MANGFFSEEWYKELTDKNNFLNLTEEEVCLVIAAVCIYGIAGMRLDLSNFNAGSDKLNGIANGYYGQVDRILNRKVSGKNKKYDDEAIEKLAREGKSQTEICKALGYDVSKSKSLSSNKGYKKGRRDFLEKKEFKF